MNSPDRVDLVVSHNQEALDAALRIVDSVEGQGCFAWADVKAFYSPLVSAERQIARAFSRARVICLFVGDKYRDTRWCQEEYGLGLRAEEDLSIDRVITVYDGDSGKALIPSCLVGRPSFPFTDAGCQGIVDFLSTLPDHSAALARWTKSGPAARGDLLGRLPVGERTKLVVEHVEFLAKHFAMGHFDQGSERHALRLAKESFSLCKAIRLLSEPVERWEVVKACWLYAVASVAATSKKESVMAATRIVKRLRFIFSAFSKRHLDPSRPR